jgi:hypothetical protein
MNSAALADTQTLLLILGFFFFFLCFVSMKLGLILMALSMLFSPEFEIGSTGWKSIAIRIEDILIVILVLAWLARIAVRRESRLFIYSPLNRPILLLLGLSIFSTLWGFAKGRVSSVTSILYLLKTMEYFVIFFLVVNYVQSERPIKLFLFFSLLTVSFIGLYTLPQVPSVQIFTTHRITAPFEGSPEPATVGGYMAFLLLILFSIFLYEEKPVMKWCYAILGIIIFIPFLFTLNRTSYISLMAGVFFIAFLERRKWLTIFLICLVVTSAFWLPHSVKDRIAYTWEDAINPGRNLGVDESLQHRIYAFPKVWGTFKYSPLIGWGVGSLDIVDSQYGRTLHEVGILGLGFWIWIFLRLFRISKWLFSSMEKGILKGMVLGYRAGLIGILLHGFGAITFYIIRIMEPFWFVSGLVVSLYLIKIREQSKAEIPAVAA